MLVNRNFTRLWYGQTISVVGNLLFDTTLMLWLATDVMAGKREAPLVSTAVPVIAAIIALIVGPMAGVFVDRWNKRRTMIRADLFRAVLLGLFALVAWLPADTVGLTTLLALIGVAVALNTVAAQFFSPARSVIIGDIVPKEERGKATGYAQAITALAGILGPTVAAPLLVGVGPQWAITANAASFVVSALCIRMIDAREPERSQQVERAGVRQEFVAGLRTFREIPTLRTLLVTIMAALLGGGTIGVVDVYFLPENLGAGPIWFGLLSASFGAGILIGSQLCGRFGDRIGHARVFSWGVVIFGALLMLYAKQTTLAPALALITTYGAALGAVNTSIMPLVLAVVPREVQGRVWSVFGISNQLAALISMAMGALLATWLSPGLRYTVVGVGFGRFDTILFVAGLFVTLSGCYAIRSFRRAYRAEASPEPRPTAHISG